MGIVGGGFGGDIVIILFFLTLPLSLPLSLLAPRRIKIDPKTHAPFLHLRCYPFGETVAITELDEVYAWKGEGAPYKMELMPPKKPLRIKDVFVSASFVVVLAYRGEKGGRGEREERGEGKKFII